jgi:hypothetical protein
MEFLASASKRFVAIQNMLLRSLVSRRLLVGANVRLQDLSKSFTEEVASLAKQQSKAQFNSRKKYLDQYFRKLLTVWYDLGGSPKGMARIHFIQACAKPVIGTRSASKKAIGNRLFRMEKRMKIRWEHCQVTFGANSKGFSSIVEWIYEAVSSGSISKDDSTAGAYMLTFSDPRFGNRFSIRLQI